LKNYSCRGEARVEKKEEPDLTNRKEKRNQSETLPKKKKRDPQKERASTSVGASSDGVRHAVKETREKSLFLLRKKKKEISPGGGGKANSTARAEVNRRKGEKKGMHRQKKLVWPKAPRRKGCW